MAAEERRVYGRWAGNPEGIPENPERCAEEVYDADWCLFRQCGRKRGHGPGGLYCKQHAKRHTTFNQLMGRVDERP